MKESIKAIQQYLLENNYDAYILFMSDDHGSEYIPDYYKGIRFLTGFTGSFGILVITKNESALWTDSRYFIQAEIELKQTETILMKIGDPTSSTFDQYLLKISNNPTICLDFKTTSYKNVCDIKLCIKPAKIYHTDILDKVFVRNKEKNSKVYLIPDKEAGLSTKEKIELAKATLDENDYILVSALDEIAWLFNIRGNDIKYNPITYAFSLIGKDSVSLYIDEAKLSKTIKDKFNSLNVKIIPYENIYQDVSIINKKILIDEYTINYSLFSKIKKFTTEKLFPITFYKSIKTKKEILNIKKAHELDAIAMIKFIHYLKSNFNKINLDELSLANTLEGYRMENKSYLQPSFELISAFKEHAAITHYSASKESNKVVSGSGLYLVDSGGQYLYGTTDITRTIVLGNITEEEKHNFTLCLKCHINLAKHQFNIGTNGNQLDKIARAPLKLENKDFGHGTGHGVGYLLNVHEGPQYITSSQRGSIPFYPGMVTSNEPGYYVKDKYGIRHENLILCKKLDNSMLGFETITLVPFDVDGIDKSLLSKEEICWLNDYHNLVYKTISPYLENNLKEYLLKITKPI